MKRRKGILAPLFSEAKEYAEPTRDRHRLLRCEPLEARCLLNAGAAAIGISGHVYLDSNNGLAVRSVMVQAVFPVVYETGGTLAKKTLVDSAFTTSGGAFTITDATPHAPGCGPYQLDPSAGAKITLTVLAESPAMASGPGVGKPAYCVVNSDGGGVYQYACSVAAVPNASDCVVINGGDVRQAFAAMDVPGLLRRVRERGPGDYDRGK